MAKFIYDRRRVIGTEQLKAEEELLTSKEYARKFSYSIQHVSKLCRAKRLRAYKSGGEWYIVSRKR